MLLQFCCPVGHALSVPESLSGRRVRCPKCGRPAQVPEGKPASDGKPTSDGKTVPERKPTSDGNRCPPVHRRRTGPPAIRAENLQPRPPRSRGLRKQPPQRPLTPSPAVLNPGAAAVPAKRRPATAGQTGAQSLPREHTGQTAIQAGQDKNRSAAAAIGHPQTNQPVLESKPDARRGKASTGPTPPPGSQTAASGASESRLGKVRAGQSSRGKAGAEFARAA